MNHLLPHKVVGSPIVSSSFELIAGGLTQKSVGYYAKKNCGDIASVSNNIAVAGYPILTVWLI